MLPQVLIKQSRNAHGTRPHTLRATNQSTLPKPFLLTEHHYQPLHWQSIDTYAPQDMLDFVISVAILISVLAMKF